MDIKQLPDKMTYGQAYDPAMKVKTAEEAAEYLAALVERRMRVSPEMTKDEAIACELGNIGYYAGYCSSETRNRVNELFNTEHPVFGKQY